MEEVVLHSAPESRPSPSRMNSLDTPATAASKDFNAMDIAGNDGDDLMSDAAGGTDGWGTAAATGTKWNLGKEYRYEKHLGTGSYGEVAKALHVPSGQTVAIKKVKGVFQDEHDARCILRELRILREARHPNIIRLLDVLPPENQASFVNLDLVFEFQQTDLEQVLHSPTYLTAEHVRWMLLDVLKAIRYLHSMHIVHRDLKPANTLVMLDPVGIKLCDFGLARSLLNEDEQEEGEAAGAAGGAAAGGATGPGAAAGPGAAPPRPKMLQRNLTKHVVTRWYRAPEVIFCDRGYTEEIDIWSVGCIFAELLSTQKESVPVWTRRSPLFPGTSCFPLSPGRKDANMPQDSQDQLNVILSVLGSMTEEDISAVKSQAAQKYLRRRAYQAPTDLRDMFPGADPEALDLLRGLLRINPQKRFTVEQALSHAYLSSIWDAQQEEDSMVTGATSVGNGDFELAAKQAVHLEFDCAAKRHMRIPELRELILNEVFTWHPEVAPATALPPPPPPSQSPLAPMVTAGGAATAAADAATAAAEVEAAAAAATTAAATAAAAEAAAAAAAAAPPQTVPVPVPGAAAAAAAAAAVKPLARPARRRSLSTPDASQLAACGEPFDEGASTFDPMIEAQMRGSEGSMMTTDGDEMYSQSLGSVGGPIRMARSVSCENFNSFTMPPRHGRRSSIARDGGRAAGAAAAGGGGSHKRGPTLHEESDEEDPISPAARRMSKTQKREEAMMMADAEPGTGGGAALDLV